MFKKAKLLQALAFSVALVPMAEVAAIIVVARHDFGMVSVPLQHHRSTVGMTEAKDSFSGSDQPVHAASSDLIMVNSTPVVVATH
jgi:hypothetical protein